MGEQGSSRATPRGLTAVHREESLKKVGGMTPLLLMKARSNERGEVEGGGVEWHSSRQRVPQ